MNVAVRLPVGDEGAGSGIHTGHFSGDRLRGFSPCFNFPVSYTPLPLSARVGASPPTRGIPGASSSPGMRNFVMFPARASWRAGERYKGPSRKCSPGLRRTRRASLGGPSYWRRRADQRTGRVSLPAPSLAFRPWALLSAPTTLCRRSPAPGMGTVAAFGPRAGFRSRVGKRGSLAPPTLGICGVVAASLPAARHISRWATLPPLRPFLPAVQRAGAGGGSHPHARPSPVLRTRPAPHHKGGVVLVYASAGREGAARGWGRRRRVGWTLTPHLEVWVQSPHAPLTSFGPEVTFDESLLHSGQDVLTL